MTPLPFLSNSRMKSSHYESLIVNTPANTRCNSFFVIDPSPSYKHANNTYN